MADVIKTGKAEGAAGDRCTDEGGEAEDRRGRRGRREGKNEAFVRFKKRKQPFSFHFFSKYDSILSLGSPLRLRNVSSFIFTLSFSQ